LNVLVACEFSGIVRDAFIKKGHNAWSCDLLPSEKPGNHLQCDVLEVLNYGWDLMIAHPPCTHLSASGAVWWEQKQKDGRQQQAIVFFMRLACSDIPKIAIENPVGIMTKCYKKADQYIHPYMFGDPYLKRTGLWLKNLDKLKPTKEVKPVAHWHGGSRRGGKDKNGERKKSKLPTALKYGWKERSRFFEGIAEAMADQWGS
jgi:site-specific DNA-cytosine methylase